MLAFVMESNNGGEQVRLGPFILANMETILSGWEDFARTHWKGPLPDGVRLRNNAEAMLRAVVDDMASDQNADQQKRKSVGLDRVLSSAMNQAAEGHALSRVDDGFGVRGLVAEFRALRATVDRLWRESVPTPHKEQIADMGRFNEAVDQLVAESIDAFTERIDRSRRLFLGILGHDLQQPVVSLSMFLNLLSKPNLPPQEVLVLADSAERCRKSLWLMMNDLVDFTSTLVGGTMPVTLSPCHLGSIATLKIEEMRAAHPARDFDLESSGNLEGEWDEGRLSQLLSNLLSNATTYGTPDTPIQVELHGEGNFVTLTVKNQGRPIPNETIGLLFDPLVRLPDERTHRPHGSIGLGLYICKQVVIAHGGEISANSTPDGFLTFSVRLPRRFSGE